MSDRDIYSEESPYLKAIAILDTIAALKKTLGEDQLIKLCGPNFQDEVNSLIRNTAKDNKFNLEEMSIEDLKTLDKILKCVKYAASLDSYTPKTISSNGNIKQPIFRSILTYALSLLIILLGVSLIVILAVYMT